MDERPLLASCRARRREPSRASRREWRGESGTSNSRPRPGPSTTHERPIGRSTPVACGRSAASRPNSPHRREPRLLIARLSLWTVVVRQLVEAGCEDERAPASERPVTAIPIAVPSLLVVAARVGGEKDAAWRQRRPQLAEDAR